MQLIKDWAMTLLRLVTLFLYLTFNTEWLKRHHENQRRNLHKELGWDTPGDVVDESEYDTV